MDHFKQRVCLELWFWVDKKPGYIFLPGYWKQVKGDGFGFLDHGNQLE